MPASDAMPVPRKNTAFRLYIDVRTSSGTLVTTWAGADSEESLDGGAFTDCTNEATEIGTSGIGFLDLTAAEMNADCTIIKITFTNTGVVTPVFYLYPQELGDIRVNATYWFDAALTATYVAPDNAGVTTLTTRLTNTRAGNLDFLTATPPTAGAIADAVWDEATSGHVAAGTTGAALAAAGASGDPLSSSVPGSYGVGTAGYQLGRIGSAAAAVASPVTVGGNVTLFAGSTYGSTTQTVVVTSATPMTLTGTPKFEIPDLDVVLDGVLTGSAGAWVLTFSFTGAQTATLQLGTRRYRVRVALTGGNLTPALIEGTVIVR